LRCRRWLFTRNYRCHERVTAGVDYKRLELLLAVLQKHCRLPVEQMDVYVNVAGGLKLSDPACDLGICLAIFSSVKNIILNRTVGIAEVGLLGELRTSNFLDKRVKQAKKLGLTKNYHAEKLPIFKPGFTINLWRQKLKNKKK